MSRTVRGSIIPTKLGALKDSASALQLKRRTLPVRVEAPRSVHHVDVNRAGSPLHARRLVEERANNGNKPTSNSSRLLTKKLTGDIPVESCK